MLERDAEVSRVGRLDTLVVAADVGRDEAPNLRLHDVLRDHQPALQIDRVALGLQAREERILERFKFGGIPRFQAADEVRRDALRAANKHVVEEVLDLTRHRIPVRFRDGAASAHLVAVRVLLGVVLGLLVVVAAHAVVLRVRHRVIGPVRQVHGRELAKVRDLLQFRWRKPKSAEPLGKRFACVPQIHSERNHRLRRNHSFDVFGLVLEVRATERAGIGDDLVFEQNHRAAPAAFRLRGAARDPADVAQYEFARVFVETALFDFPSAVFHVGRVPAVRAFQRALARIELDLRAAVQARE